MKKFGNVVGVLGVLWLVYFWTAVSLYPHFRMAMPGRLNTVGILTIASAAACGFAGATVSRYWWMGVGAALITVLIIQARVH